MERNYNNYPPEYYQIPLETPNRNEEEYKPKKPVGVIKIFLFIVLGIFIIMASLPLLGLIFCVVLLAYLHISDIFTQVLPILSISFTGITITSLAIAFPKKITKKKFISMLPYFIFMIFFSLLYLGGVVHQETNVCSLVSKTTLLIKPLFSYFGMVISGIFFISKSRKI